MSVWFAIPSKRPPAEAEPILDKWRAQGYLVAIFRDYGDSALGSHLMIRGAYPGYAAAVNALCRQIIAIDSEAEWLVTGGDDVEPDPNRTAEQIARDCGMWFGGSMPGCSHCDHSRDLFGVMQPTGDRWGDEPWSRQRWPDAPAYIDRICGSPWIGREFARRMYGGRGPLWEGYHHMFEDEELQNVAQKLGVFWQRRDLVHYHHHWMREQKPAPAFLHKANAEYQQSRVIYEKRFADGFPGHEPIA